MRLRRPIAFILSAAVAASALTGCDSFSGHAAAAANSAQVQQLIEFIADLGLERDLRQALQSGGDLRQALLTLLGLENAVNFNVDGLTGARPGQHAVQVWEVTAQSAEDAAALAASQIRAVLEQLKSSGVTEGRIGMVEVDGKYYVVVDVEVTEENTFEPAKPVSDDDDDSEDDTIPGVTVENGLLIVNVAELGLDENDIDADAIIKKINEQAGTEYNRNNIKAVILPEGLESIGNPNDSYDPGAFAYCENLTTVTLPSSVTSIGGRAFYNCSGLEEINLGNCTSLESIGTDAFYKCTSLTSITLPAGLQSIGNSAFASSGLTEIDLGNCTKLTTIGDAAFNNCTGPTRVTLPSSVTTIGNLAFQNCTSLKEINLNGCASLESIGVGVFQNCTSLETITLPSTVTEIGNSAFYDCTILTSITLPESLKRIDNSAFCNCSNLKNIYFQSVPTEIHEKAFDGVNASDLTVYYPSSWGSEGDKLQDLKKVIEGKGFSGDFGTIKFVLGPPSLAYLFNL